jgi:hypothetical protein
MASGLPKTGADVGGGGVSELLGGREESAPSRAEMSEVLEKRSGLVAGRAEVGGGVPEGKGKGRSGSPGGRVVNAPSGSGLAGALTMPSGTVEKGAEVAGGVPKGKDIRITKQERQGRRERTRSSLLYIMAKQDVVAKDVPGQGRRLARAAVASTLDQTGSTRHEGYHADRWKPVSRSVGSRSRFRFTQSGSTGTRISIVGSDAAWTCPLQHQRTTDRRSELIRVSKTIT